MYRISPSDFVKLLEYFKLWDTPTRYWDLGSRRYHSMNELERVLEDLNSRINEIEDAESIVYLVAIKCKVLEILMKNQVVSLIKAAGIEPSESLEFVVNETISTLAVAAAVDELMTREFVVENEKVLEILRSVMNLSQEEFENVLKEVGQVS